jgi:hypothetical protein
MNVKIDNCTLPDSIRMIRWGVVRVDLISRTSHTEKAVPLERFDNTSQSRPL